jgi:hypothetical protein
VVCDFFEMETLCLAADETCTLSGKGPLVVMGVGGAGTVRMTAGAETVSVRNGETRLVPAAIAEDVSFKASGGATLLSVRIP